MRQTRIFLATALLAALAGVLGPAATARADKPNKVWSFTPETGFVGDPMAFDTAGAQLAYIHTDSASFLDLVVLDTATRKERAKIRVEDPARIPEALVFTPDGKQLVLIWMDSYKGTRGASLSDIASAKLLKQIGPANHAAVVAFKDEQVVTLTDTKPDRQGNNNFRITAFRTRDFRRAARGQIKVQADLQLKNPPIRVLYWEPGHVSVVGVRKGEYDRKRDIRLPARAVRYNVLLRKVTWSEEPKEIVKWTQATNMRPNHLGQYQFLEVGDELKTLYHVDRQNDLDTVATPVKWELYEPKSLVQSETWDGDALYFSLTIDPVNRLAVKRKKADVERVDIYRLDSGAKPTLLGQVKPDKRRFGWVASKSFFAYLYKLKGFGRGGREIVLFRTAK